jgi:hypothetical protein
LRPRFDPSAPTAGNPSRPKATSDVLLTQPLAPASVTTSTIWPSAVRRTAVTTLPSASAPTRAPPGAASKGASATLTTASTPSVLLRIGCRCHGEAARPQQRHRRRQHDGQCDAPGRVHKRPALMADGAHAFSIIVGKMPHNSHHIEYNG